MKRKKKVQDARAKVAARRTEIMVNLNMFTSPTDEDIPPMDSYNVVQGNYGEGEYEVCPEEYERRAAGMLKLMHLCAPTSLLGRKVPSCCVRVEPDGMLVMHMRAIWGGRKPVLVGMARKDELITADALKCSATLLLNPKRLVFNMVNGVDLPKLTEDYWRETQWHAIHYIPMKTFHQFAEKFLQSVLRVPRDIDERIDGIAVIGDDRWMPDGYGDGVLVRDAPR